VLEAAVDAPDSRSPLVEQPGTAIAGRQDDVLIAEDEGDVKNTLAYDMACWEVHALRGYMTNTLLELKLLLRDQPYNANLGRLYCLLLQRRNQLVADQLQVLRSKAHRYTNGAGTRREVPAHDGRRRLRRR
jgi:hypothetical protein